MFVVCSLLQVAEQKKYSVNMAEKEKNGFVKQVAERKYAFGFTTDVHTEIIEKGLNEDIIRLISKKKNEPQWLLDFRLKAYQYWKGQ